MNRIEIYRRRAQDCLKFADKFTLIELQDCLLSMAAPTKYELVINLKTSKTLGVESVLARADEVIE